MLDPDILIDALGAQGCRTFTGVPCSHLTPLMEALLARRDTDYLAASSEGDALAVAAGHWLGGGSAAVLCQNSGLGNIVNPLTSLNEPFGIPVLILMTWRGRPGVPDEPQHERMGQVTPALLDLLGVRWEMLPDDDRAAGKLIAAAFAHMERTRMPFVLLVPGECFAPAAPAQGSPRGGLALPTRAEMLSAISSAVPPQWAIIATTGKTGRELFTIADRPNRLYCVGSMGYANALAHGLARAAETPVLVVDGDGAALMHLGNLATIGAAAPAGLIHVILDNQCYDSTGGQPSMSPSIDFPALARAMGYRAARRCGSAAELAQAIRTFGPDGPMLLHVPIAAGSMPDLARPTIGPRDVAVRLRRHMRAVSLDHQVQPEESPNDD